MARYLGKRLLISVATLFVILLILFLLLQSLLYIHPVKIP